MSGIRLPDLFKLFINWKNNNDFTIYWHDATVNFFDVVLFLLSSLVTGPDLLSTSLLVLEVWQFTFFIRGWSEIRKSEMPLYEFCTILGDWDELGIPNLARMSLIKCYLGLQNARVTTITVSELLRQNQQVDKVNPSLHQD